MVPLNKDEIHTLIGSFHKNDFTTIDGETFDCVTYKNILDNIPSNKTIAANFRWSDTANRWIIFQYIPLD